MISFIIPAHNEARLLGATVQAIHGASANLAELYEVIVVDDASTDATAEVAVRHDATVVPVAYRQIAATRNAGARHAQGEVLIFVDADTIVDDAVIRAALRTLRTGAVGGGAVAAFEPPIPLFARVMIG